MAYRPYPTVNAGLTALLFATFLISCPPALADADSTGAPPPEPVLPQLNSPGHCRQLVDLGDADQAAFQRCLRMESVARQRLQNHLSRYSPPELQRCTRLMEAVGAGYMGLKYCLEHNV